MKHRGIVRETDSTWLVVDVNLYRVTVHVVDLQLNIHSATEQNVSHVLLAGLVSTTIPPRKKIIPKNMDSAYVTFCLHM